MNAVEIEAAVSELAASPFDPKEFPFFFLEAFGNKSTTIAKLRKGVSNQSDVPNGVLQRNNIHMAVAPLGEVSETLSLLRSSPKTAQAKVKFILSTDGETVEAEELSSGETVAKEFGQLADLFGFFLPLAGISTVKEIKENPIDVRATGRLNKLYIELLKTNPDWATEAKRPDLNHFLARLIFCFFAEDTDIFHGSYPFTATVEKMTERDGSNTHSVLEVIFRAMNTKVEEKKTSDLPNYALGFPYVNGGLFSGSVESPRFSKIARTYLLRAGELNWRQINPDIFGSMIQAVADDEERGLLGMHYTSVPNILKVLNPLFLDDLRDQLERAGDHKASLLKLRDRMSKIRVFDPACGSGNFLVIAYKVMRAIEAKINRRRGEPDRASVIYLTNFRGIELRDFAAEIARLALIIAEFQCDVLHRGPKLALAEFLPLTTENWIVCGNALRLDWTTVCPPTGTGVKLQGDDLFSTPLEQAEIDFQNAGGEVFICGNPPYAGLSSQNETQKADLHGIFNGYTRFWRSFDYVFGWFWKSSQMLISGSTRAAFVTTNSVCQGQQVPMCWPLILANGVRISFAYESFRWQNLASRNAGVTVSIIGLTRGLGGSTKLLSHSDSGLQVLETDSLNAYLIPGRQIYVEPSTHPRTQLSHMVWGNKPVDGGNLILSIDEARDLVSEYKDARQFIRHFFGSAELIYCRPRACLWIPDDLADLAQTIPPIRNRIEAVRRMRLLSKAAETRPSARYPHRFRQVQGNATNHSIAVPGVSSEVRDYLPVDLLDARAIISNLAFALYDAPLWNLAILASRLHLVWIGTVCGKLKTDFRYSNTLGWNTFPIPQLTEHDKADLTTCAEEILLARERHFPKSIADLYAPDQMPEDLRHAHARNDEALERIYIGRRFKNDTERLEKLFEMYEKMTSSSKPNTISANRGGVQ